MPGIDPAAVDLSDAEAVVRTLDAAAGASLEARCREGSIDRVCAPGRVILTGDLHDNPVHFAKLVGAAGLAGTDAGNDGDGDGGAHLVLHEVIHSDRLVGGVDLSHRALVRIAALKAAHPERVHVLLANHELAQIVGSGVVKDGVRVVDAFNDGVEYVFGDDAGAVRGAIERFIRAMPLALRCVGGASERDSGATREGGEVRGEEGHRDILCAHSLPAPHMMERFDAGVLERELTDEDYEPRRGSAHLMVWGREHKPDQLRDLAGRWGVSLFVLGHEHAENGAMFRPPNAVILNSDHERGVMLPVDLDDPPGASAAMAMVVPLGGTSL